MPDYNDYFQRELNAVNAAVGTGIFPAAPAVAFSLNSNNAYGKAINPNALPIRTITLISRTTLNPTVTYLVEGSLDGINWVSMGIPGGTPAVGAPRKDVVDAANMLYIRINITAMSAGNLSCDLLLQGTPS